MIAPYYAWILIDTPKFLKHRSVHQCIFFLLWDKTFWQNRDTLPLLSMRVFYINFFWNTVVFPYEFFRHCETNCFRRKIEILYPAPSLSITFFITRKFLKNRRVPLWSFPVMRDRNFSTNLYTPHSYSWKICISEFIRNTDVFPYDFYQHCENNFKGERWYPLLIHKFFYNGNILKYRSDALGSLYVIWDKKKSIKNWRPFPPLPF